MGRKLGHKWVKKTVYGTRLRRCRRCGETQYNHQAIEDGKIRRHWPKTAPCVAKKAIRTKAQFDVVNKKRHGLIDRLGKLTPKEEAILDDLQQRTRDYVEWKFPISFGMLEAAEREIFRMKRRKKKGRRHG